MRKFRFRNSSFISAVSVALVLCLIGMECVLLLSAGALVTRMREKMTLTAVLTKDVDSVQCAELEELLADQTRFSNYTFVSADQALQDYIDLLGEDPTKFTGYNPLTASYEIHPTEIYSHPDSLASIVDQLENVPYVDKVEFPMQVANVIGRPAQRMLWIMSIVALVLLVVAFVLIVNTIRLQIYAKRFLINTMTLVGATSWVTRRPFVLRNVLMGFVAALFALMVIGCIVYYAHYRLEILLFPLTPLNIACVAGVVIGSGLLITLIASLTATGRYIRMDNNSLYEV